MPDNTLLTDSRTTAGHDASARVPEPTLKTTITSMTAESLELLERKSRQ